MRWKLTVRSGPKVERSSFTELDRALDVLEQRAREVADTAPKRTVDAKIRQFEPVQQVVARLELAGPQRFVPSVRAGIDVRGDGSIEAYRGRVRRVVIEARPHETPLVALRRSLVS